MRRYASAVYAVVLCLSVTSRYCISKRRIEPALGWHGGFLPPIAHSAVRKFGYLQTLGTSLWYFVPYSGLAIYYFATVDLYRKHPRPVCRRLRRDFWLILLLVSAHYISVHGRRGGAAGWACDQRGQCRPCCTQLWYSHLYSIQAYESEFSVPCKRFAAC